MCLNESNKCMDVRDTGVVARTVCPIVMTMAMLYDIIDGHLLYLFVYDM